MPVALPLAIDAQIAPFVIMLAVGFLVGTIGHVIKSRTVVAIGIGLIVLATVLPLVLLSPQKAAP